MRESLQTFEKLEVAEPIPLQEANRPRKVVGRCERDAGRLRCGQEQIGCDTGKHVRP